jgi:cysteine desulfurase/selenocysteine lyase
MSISLADRIRGDFPILSTEMNGKPLIYFDNAATTQKPRAVIDAIVKYYSCDNANIHRGVYELSQRATEAYENARKVVASFLGGVDSDECIFTRGTTESINLVASSWGRKELKEGDEVLLTGLEHHSNIVPWQMICLATGARLRIVQPNPAGEIELSDFTAALSSRTRMVAIQSVSNSLGTIHDITQLIRAARGVGAKILLDGAQSIAHLPTDLISLDCDFYAFSGHKLYGPTGIGILWGRRKLLESMPPFMGGGDMIESVSFENTTYAGVPNRFEAGTPHIAGAIGLAAAIEYVQSIGFAEIASHEEALLLRTTERLGEIPGVRIIGTAKHKAAIVSFVVDRPSIAPLDIATELSHEGIAVRTGHHCCMPLMQHLGVSGTSRASMAIYNTFDEVDRFAEVLARIVKDRQSLSVPASGSLESESMCRDVSNILFAVSSGESPDKIADDLADDFLFCDDPQSKTKLLIEFGQQLPDSFDQLKRITTAVPGCMSEVYVLGRPSKEDPSRLELAGDSNAQIVRGLIAVLQKLLSGQPASSILEFDLEGFFRRIGLDQFITSQRRSGLAGMIRRIRKLAEGIVERNLTTGTR